MTKEKRPLLVAVDDGYAQVKLAAETPDGGLVQFVMRSSARPGRYGLGAIGGGAAVGSYETAEGDQWTVSEDIEAEDTKFDGYHTSGLNRVLVHHAMMQAGFGGREVALVTGLPLADYFFDDERDEEKIAAKRDNLMKAVLNASSSAPMPVVRSVDVGCQAVAAWVDWIFGDDLEVRDGRDPGETIAVVDVGGRTTDVAVVVGGRSIDHSRSGTENIGVLDVYGALSKAIRQKFRVRDKFPLGQMDQTVRTGTIRLWNEEHDVSELVRDVTHETEGKIAREVERRLGSASTLSSLVFVGGGGALFKTIAQRFPNGHLADQPEFANAKGMWKYFKQRQSEG